MNGRFLSTSTCKIRRTSIRSEIRSILKRNCVAIKSTDGILIGSRAARHYFANFRQIRFDNNADWNIIGSSEFFLAWWNERDDHIENIEMIIPKSKDGTKFDLFIHCLLTDGSNYHFIIPCSSLTYSAYLLENSDNWTMKRYSWTRLIRKGNCIITASSKLLFMMKKSMLYYDNQWMKTAKDYRQLMTIVDPLTEDEQLLWNLLVQYNEKIFGRRPMDNDQFDLMSSHSQMNITINRNEFFQKKILERIEFLYEIVQSLSMTGEILSGFKYLCTQSPLWLSDYLIDNWIRIENEKFKEKLPSSHPSLNIEIADHLFFPQLTKPLIQRILSHINDATDFHRMELVCQQWYAILHQQSFWKDLYIFRYGTYSNMNDWKMLYLIRIQGEFCNENCSFGELINATMDLRQCKAIDVLQLWQDLTHEQQSVDLITLARIDSMLSNAFYYQMNEKDDQYTVKLVLDGLKVQLTVRITEYKTAHFTDHIEELSFECKSNEEMIRSLKFIGPHLFGFDFDYLGYIDGANALLTSTASFVFSSIPQGFLICLFVMISHPSHRLELIQYLKSVENRCLEKFSEG